MTGQDFSSDLDHLDAALQAMFEVDGEALQRLRVRTERSIREAKPGTPFWGTLVSPLRSPATALAYAVAVLVVVATSVGLGTVVLTKYGSSHPHLVVPAASATPSPLELSPSPPAAPGPYSTRAAAEAFALQSPMGAYLAASPGESDQDWGEGLTLHVVEVNTVHGASTWPNYLFFFVNGFKVGEYTVFNKSGSRIDSSTWAVVYHVYQPNDAQCCPSSLATVRFHWDGSRLVPLDPLQADVYHRGIELVP